MQTFERPMYASTNMGSFSNTLGIMSDVTTTPNQPLRTKASHANNQMKK
jgi:hypothetical protein